MLIWPEKPVCHKIPDVIRHDPIWRSPRMRQNAEDPYQETFRTCSYCGSIHPEDLHNLLVAGVAKLGGSDWKYGWPHKFYVEGIPNPVAGEPVSQYVYCGNPERLKDRGIGEIEGTEHGGFRRKLYDRPAPDNLTAKWYNEHLLDIADEFTFKTMADLLETHAHIRFMREADRLAYSAPCAGYQK